MAAIPDVPTIAESGLPGLEIVQYYGLVAPAGTPQPIIDRLNKELRKIVSSDDMQKRLLDAGGDPLVGTPAEYARNIEREENKWQAVIKKLGLVVNN
jgi:tripartite-type tricarboxylate transporter receptor subunit TctC